MFYITRQSSCLGEHYVEVVEGSVDNISPDALSPKYDGELTPIEPDCGEDIVEIVKYIAERWKKEEQGDIMVAFGNTLGASIMLELEEYDEELLNKLKTWVEEIMEEQKEQTQDLTDYIETGYFDEEWTNGDE